jgi:hypothetical protein
MGTTDLGETGLVLDASNSPANVTLDGGGRVIDLTGSNQGSLITVGVGVTLTLKNITFKGLKKDDPCADGNGADGNNNNRYLIRVNGGTLILEDGAVISDNYSELASGVAAGVLIYSGNLIMNGGAISNNKAESGGGGVYVYPGAKFTMSGGDISGNTCDIYAYGVGVGVHTGGEFIMSGGAISNNIYSNSSSPWGNGGGVCVRGGKFTMSGGAIISGNSISGNNDPDTFFGGGVGVLDGGEFIMKGGFISGNTAAQYGGGVGVSGGTFTKADLIVPDGGDGFSGTIYGSDAGEEALKNKSNIGQGHAAYAGGKKRDNTAYDGDNMDSAQTGVDGGWEL